MYGYIYLVSNLINSKIYVGQHKSAVFDSTYLGSGKQIKNAIKKYGKENFKVDLIEEASNPEDLNNLEIQYVALYKATDPNIGYNMSAGGYVPRLCGIHNGNYGKK